MTLEWRPVPVRLHDLLRGADGGGLVAVVDGERNCTFAEFRQRVERMAAGLHSAGIQRGDRVAVLLPKCLEECVALFAASRVDAVVVPINPVLRAEQVQHILSDSEARVLLSRNDVLAGLRLSLDDLHVLDVDAEPTVGLSGAVPQARAIAQDLAAILYTSGSTGSPKGVMLSHGNLLAGTRIVRSYLGITAADRLLSVLPFSFDYGLNQLLTTIEQRATLVLLSFQLGDQIVSQLARHRITGLAGVPTVWAILTKAAPTLQKTALPHLRYITNSGGAVPEPTVRRLRQLLPDTRIFLMYGLTEAFRSTYLPPEQVDQRPTSIGRAIPESEVWVVTADGRRAAPGEHGVLVHRGPTVSLGYWRRPEDTQQVLRQNPLRGPHEGGDIVCWSGDLVYEDDEGYLYFVGRRDNLIKCAGHRISPTEVEDALMATGAFSQVAVVGVADEWTGQRIVAVGVAADGSVNDSASAGVLQALVARLPAHMVPKRIDWVNRLPLSPNGKVDYRLLAAERSI